MVLIYVVEDISSEALYLADDVPTLVVIYAVVDVVSYPAQLFVTLLQRVDHIVYCLFLHIVVIQTNAKIGCEVQLMGQVAQNTLKKASMVCTRK